MKRQLNAISEGNPLPVKRHADVPGTGSPRRSVRLQAQLSTARIVSPLKSQVETDARSASNRATLPQTNTQQPSVNREETSRVAETGRRRKPTDHPYTSLPVPKVEWLEQASPATLLRKRPIDDDSDSDSDSEQDGEHRPKRTRLTRKNLALFNKMAKNKGKKASAYAPPESTAQSSSTTQAKTISTTSSGFADQADKNGILNTRRSKRPENYEDTANRLARSRETASPPESAYRRYIKATGKSGSTEMTVLVEMAPLLKTYHDDDGYSREFNRSFTGLPKDLGFNNGLSAPQPDFIEGLEKREYHPFPIDERVRRAVLYKDDPDSLALPHLAGAWKGPGKDMEEARLQSAYDGAALVYGRSQALDSIGKPYLAGHAKVTTFTTDGTSLNFFSHYAALSEDGTLEYHQYAITSTNLKNSFEEFKRARRQLRNAQDDARAESHELRDQFKEYWKARKSETALLPAIEDDDSQQLSPPRLSPGF
ncbi:hypothetical protein B0T19DRAFT_447654 [Cercophora scortea]|uniref:Uncharacterized protein n=1 Tax=Cercophora scortea TaxID=314031 RepID=A0AAE0MLF3_9PEZI|nr:hypothetical protein B0T19DRAFT_447654 [Cercophora scortea]